MNKIECFCGTCVRYTIAIKDQFGYFVCVQCGLPSAKIIEIGSLIEEEE